MTLSTNGVDQIDLAIFHGQHTGQLPKDKGKWEKKGSFLIDIYRLVINYRTNLMGWHPPHQVLVEYI